VALLGLVAQVCPAETSPKVALDSSESLFTVLTAINACGYDSELNASDPLRAQIRDEVAKTIEASAEAKEATPIMCQFYAEHQPADPARTLAQYVSLALYLEAPPALSLKVKEADLPPDASYVSGFVPLIQKFYGEAGLHAIWTRHQLAYSDLTERYHGPLSKVLFDTEVYLKLPSAGYLGRTFSVYLDPMGAPGQANARDYGTDYYVVISPGTGSGLKMDQIRHTYLHYLLDPLALKYPIAMAQLAPLLVSVKNAPMDESFKTDVSLLATECLIRAIEARTTGSSKTPEIDREKLVEQSVEQGFVLTPYFYQALVRFEKSPAGLRIAYADLISGIDVHKEQKNAAQIKFASKADPELLHLSRPAEAKLLVTAEQRLSSGDAETAKKLAQQALDEKREDPGRALFILAQVATMSRDMPGARNYFEQALNVAHEPKVVAWSHIYLGRIFDLQEDRAGALDHYRAALTAGGSLPEAKAAAEHGIEQPYEPPSHPQ
jgi:tetratricopeptide (TPR) repeat protein